MQDLIQFFEELSKTNPYLFAFLMLALGAIGNSLRTIPRDIYNWLWRVFTCRIEVSNHDNLYESVKIWLNQQPYSDRSRFLVGTCGNGDSMDDDYFIKSKTDVLFTPAPGNHFFWYKGQFLCISLRREKQENVIASGRELPPPKETITLCLPGRDQARIRRLISDITNTAEQYNKDKAFIYVLDGSYWYKTSSVHRRPISSVLLPEGISKKILDDVNEFRSKKDWYNNIGIPYHRGYLLHGIPGSGKTSLVSAVSDELNMNLYTINLASGRLDDDTLNKIMLGMKPDSIILIEDIDAIFSGRKNTSKSQVTFSGLLNAIDGVSSRDGTILFMTTNHKERLDPALIRPGRVDVDIYFGYATVTQTSQMLQRFYPETLRGDINQFIISCKDHDLSMAQIQKHLLKYKNSFINAFDNIEEMFEHKFIEASDVEENEEEEEEESTSVPEKARMYNVISSGHRLLRSR